MKQHRQAAALGFHDCGHAGITLDLLSINGWENCDCGLLSTAGN